mmetsp:Transcript_48456/g.156497  ORF Transcript_48456/g.156497 Transcript_48456/m.156497 type:complete len:397 (-) Transcript_48456:1418-2608(-)
MSSGAMSSNNFALNSAEDESMQNLSCVTGCKKDFAIGQPALATIHGTLATRFAWRISGKSGVEFWATAEKNALSGEFKCFKPTPSKSITANIRSTTRPCLRLSAPMTTCVRYSMHLMWKSTTALTANPAFACNSSPSSHSNLKASKSTFPSRWIITGCPCLSVRWKEIGMADMYFSIHFSGKGPLSSSESTFNFTRTVRQRANHPKAPSAHSAPYFLSWRACQQNRNSDEGKQPAMAMCSMRAFLSSLCSGLWINSRVKLTSSSVGKYCGYFCTIGSVRNMPSRRQHHHHRNHCRTCTGRRWANKSLSAGRRMAVRGWQSRVLEPKHGGCTLRCKSTLSSTTVLERPEEKLGWTNKVSPLATSSEQKLEQAPSGMSTWGRTGTVAKTSPSKSSRPT